MSRTYRRITVCSPVSVSNTLADLAHYTSLRELVFTTFLRFIYMVIVNSTRKSRTPD